MITGTSERSRIRSIVSYPSIPGIATSRMTSAGGDAYRSRSATRPSEASSTVKPARVRSSRRSERMSSSSSTTRIFARAGVVIRLSYSQAAPLPADAGHAGSVARILIAEPHADVRSLLEIVIARLGHEAVVHHRGDPPSPLDAAVIEPGDGTGLELARRLRDRGVPV